MCTRCMGRVGTIKSSLTLHLVVILYIITEQNFIIRGDKYSQVKRTAEL